MPNFAQLLISISVALAFCTCTHAAGPLPVDSSRGVAGSPKSFAMGQLKQYRPSSSFEVYSFFCERLDISLYRLVDLW